MLLAGQHVELTTPFEPHLLHLLPLHFEGLKGVVQFTWYSYTWVSPLHRALLLIWNFPGPGQECIVTGGSAEQRLGVTCEVTSQVCAGSLWLYFPMDRETQNSNSSSGTWPALDKEAFEFGNFLTTLIALGLINFGKAQ